MRNLLVCSMCLVSNFSWAGGQEGPAWAPVSGDVELKDFKFQSGKSLPVVRMHYRTIGNPKRDQRGVVANAVLILHGTSGDGASLLRPEFTDPLFGPGEPLDAAKFYIILPDNLGHGRSSKPSDGLRASFPAYGYLDMVQAQHRLLVEGLGVQHVRLILGTSMGGMHVWLWGQQYPDSMDALMPLASLPTQVSGRNRMWRKLISDTIRSDPLWQQGNYQKQPPSLRTAVQVMLLMSSNPVLRQKEGPTLKAADDLLEKSTAVMAARLDATDLLYAVEASSDYDPAVGLGKIKAPLLAVNFADDLINPPELGILESKIQEVPRGKALTIPFSSETIGHGTHTKAIVWKRHLVELLDSSKLNVVN